MGGQENKGNLKGRTNEYLEEKTPVEIIEERKQRLRTSRMDTRLRTPAPRRKGWVGGKNKDNFGQGKTMTSEEELRIELGKDEEARVNLTRNASDQKS